MPPGSPELCHALWTKPQLQDGPVLAALTEARTFFPAFPVPLVSLLESLIADVNSAHAAMAYFGNISHVTTLHHAEDTDLEVMKGGKSVVAAKGIGVTGVPWLVIKPVRGPSARVRTSPILTFHQSFFVHQICCCGLNPELLHVDRIQSAATLVHVMYVWKIWR